MKKIISIFAIAALFVATVSCGKEEATVPEEENNVEEPVVPEDPKEDENLPEGMIRLSFRVSAENDAPAQQVSAAPSRTSWDGTTHAWSNGDHIRIIVGEGDVEGTDYVDAEVVSGSVSAVVPDAEYYYAVYPATATYTYTAAEGKISVSFGRNQSGSFADANIMAAKTSKAAASFAFKNMTSILKFSTGASAAYNKVTFCANDKTKLNGTVSTTFAEPFAVVNTPATNSDAVLLSVNVEASGTYYAAILPDVTLSNGIGFKVDAANQDTGALSTASLSMGRSDVQNLGTLDNMIHKDWFIKEDGTGKGTSWEDAGGPERLVQLIYPDQSRGDGAGLTAAYRLHKATIHVAAGTYNIQAANGDEVLAPHYNTGALNFTIKGGYPANLAGTAKTGYDPATNKTNFICNQATASDRVFLLSGSNKIPNITFDGITFPANGASLAPGTAFDFNSSAASNINFNNCYFTGFVQSGTVNGGPVYVQSTGAANISFTDCTFSNNTCNTGGAIYLYNANATVSFTDCMFSNNSTTANGGALRARSFASLTITGGSFVSNSVTGSGNKGGGVFLDAGSLSIVGTTFTSNSAAGRGGALQFNSSAESSVDGATFTSNNASNGACIHTEAGNVTVTNSTFSGNTGTNGGAVRVLSSSLVLDNCTLQNNSTTGQGGAIDVQSSGKVTVYNSSFSGNSSVKGSAVITAGAADAFAVLLVFNSLFNGNTSASSANNGGAIHSSAYGRILVANSTIRATGGEGDGSAIMSAATSNYPKMYFVSCTLAENGYAFNRNYNNVWFYNTIGTDDTVNSKSNLKARSAYTIWGSKRYAAMGTLEDTVDGLAASCLQSFATDHYPLNSSASASYGAGMSATDIQALSFSDITLTDDQLALLAKDQKGNDREGTIMGAYVRTE